MVSLEFLVALFSIVLIYLFFGLISSLFWLKISLANPVPVSYLTLNRLRKEVTLLGNLPSVWKEKEQCNQKTKLIALYFLTMQNKFSCPVVSKITRKRGKNQENKTK